MTRRTATAIESLPHYVYLHLDANGDVIYAGRTCNPVERPADTKGREWIASESREVVVSPAMSFEAACWAEDRMILAANPRHNTRRGQHQQQDPRIAWIADAYGVTRTIARTWAPWHPIDRAAFDEFVAQHAQLVSTKP